MRSDEGNLLGWCEAGDAVAEVAEVLRTRLEMKDLLYDGREVGQRANRCQRWCIGGTCQATRRSQSQRVLDCFKRYLAFIELHREHSVRAADRAAHARSRAVGFQKPADILALLHEFSLAARAATGR